MPLQKNTKKTQKVRTDTEPLLKQYIHTTPQHLSFSASQPAPYDTKKFPIKRASSFRIAKKNLLTLHQPRRAMVCANLNLPTKVPLVFFEGYELICNYAHEQETHLKARNILVISALVAIYLAICYKQLREKKSIIKHTQRQINMINIRYQYLRTNSAAIGASIEKAIHCDLRRPDIKLTKIKSISISTNTRTSISTNSHTSRSIIQHHESVLPAPKQSTYPKPTTKADHQPGHTHSIQSHTYIDAIENFELWIGIVWLAYCFLDDFHEDKIPTSYLLVIIGCGIGYTLLQIALNKGMTEKEVLEKINKFSICMDKIYDQYHLTVAKNHRRASLQMAGAPPQNPRPSLRRHSF